MDVLAEVFQLIRVRGKVYFKTDFSGDWGMEIAHPEGVTFHIIEQGRCILVTHDDQQIYYLEQGDCVILPHMTAHSLKRNTDSNVVSGQKVIQKILTGKPPFAGGTVNLNILCGSFAFDSEYADLILDSLPRVIHLQASEHSVWLRQTMMMLCYELDHQALGNQLMINHLLELLFIQSLRNVSVKQLSAGLLLSVNEPRVHAALQAFHYDIGRAWTLPLLAKRAGLSRTGLVTKFMQCLGMPPGSYMTRWRLITASKLLTNSEQSIESIANRVGYRSTAAFTVAFIKQFELSPGRFRKRKKLY